MGALYYVAMAGAMLIGMHYLQASTNVDHPRIWLHFVGISAIAVFFGLIIAGLIIGPPWVPFAAIAAGAIVQALLEEHVSKSPRRLGRGVGAKIVALSAHYRSRPRVIHVDGSRDPSPPPAA